MPELIPYDPENDPILQQQSAPIANVFAPAPPSLPGVEVPSGGLHAPAERSPTVQFIDPTAGPRGYAVSLPGVDAQPSKPASQPAAASVQGGAGTTATPQPSLSPKPMIGDPFTPSTDLPGVETATDKRRAKEEQELERLQDTGSGVDQLQKKHGFLGGLARVGDVIGSIAAPRIMSMIPGTSLHHEMLEGQQRKMLGSDITGQDTESQTAERNAQTQHENAETVAAGNSDKTLDTADGIMQYNPRTGRYDIPAAQPPLKDGTQIHILPDGTVLAIHSDPASGKSTPEVVYKGDPKVDTDIKQLQVGGKPHQVLFNKKDGSIIKDLGESGEKPPSVNVSPGTWSLQNGQDGKPVLFNNKTGEIKDAPAGLSRKPNAEEEKRADLAQNVNENLDKLEDIVQRRPELFGPVHSWETRAKEAIGTSDPDIAALKTLGDNLGMAMQSAHGMRSAQHVETSAQSVLNGFKNNPQALLAAIQTARQSVGTFQKDVQNPNVAGQPEQQSGGGAGHIIEVGGKHYQYKGSGPTDDMNSYQEVKK